MGQSAALLPGTLDLLILKAVSLEVLHGYGILLRIEQISGGALSIEQGALYPALARLERQHLHRREVGDLRQQPESQVLPVDGRGAAAASGGDRRLAAARQCDGGCAQDEARGGVTCDGWPGSPAASPTCSGGRVSSANHATSSRFTSTAARRSCQNADFPPTRRTGRRTGNSAACRTTSSSSARRGAFA